MSEAYQENLREEMLDGRIVAMAPPTIWHHEISFHLALAFKEFLRGKPCKAFSDGVAVYLTEKDYVIPDVMIVCNPNIIGSNGIHGAPNLIVEILSPGTQKNDRGYKKELYEKNGIEEYWIISPTEKTIEVYLLKNGKYWLDEVYQICPENIILLPGEKEKYKDTVKVSLYENFYIPLEQIFGNNP
ncbi:MAG: Uma2 family endonuclease [Oscillospiraceae bacterium]|jgi:Uma2 family endonuclease|nr:Uma2 family endonuclease [Oscillospiraceae bacterium]